MSFDYKKEYKEFYAPKGVPSIVTVPPMRFVAVRGQGDPNDENGEYQRAMGALYGVSFALKMSRKADRQIEGWFDYVVPPLEGFWWMEGMNGIDYARKAEFRWISVIRLPDFITKADFDWAIQQMAEKKKDAAGAEFFEYDEGLCVQCMHIGPYDDEPETIANMDGFAAANGYRPDFANGRMHHEIYLSDARRCAPEKLRTVLRHPVAR